MSHAHQVTGSHDHSLRLWEKTDEPLILSEERERVRHTHTHTTLPSSPLPLIWQERETLFEEAVAEGREPVVREQSDISSQLLIVVLV